MDNTVIIPKQAAAPFVVISKAIANCLPVTIDIFPYITFIEDLPSEKWIVELPTNKHLPIGSMQIGISFYIE